MRSDLRRFYLVRHGITDWNREMRMQGHTDVPLSPEGVKQAQRIGARLSAAPHPPTAVWSSDLKRASATAEAIADPLGLKVVYTALLRETMLGEWEGLTRPEIVARGDETRLNDYLRDSYRFRPPGSETMEEVWQRLIAAADQIREECPSGDIVIVGHGGSLRALLCFWIGAPITSMKRFWLDNASLSIVEEKQVEKQDEAHHDGEMMSRLTLLNDTSHLKDLET